MDICLLVGIKRNGTTRSGRVRKAAFASEVQAHIRYNPMGWA